MLVVFVENCALFWCAHFRAICEWIVIANRAVAFNNIPVEGVGVRLSWHRVCMLRYGETSPVRVSDNATLENRGAEAN